MSAFICSDKHIATMAILLVTPDKVQDFANKLKQINIDSVNYRYNEKTPKRKCKLIALDECFNVTMHDLYRLYQCWDYQACEGDFLDYQIMHGYLEHKFKKLGYTAETPNESKLWSI